jgi:putative transposase
MRFFEKAMRDNGTPEKIAMDKSGANKKGIDEINGAMPAPITVRQVKYLNNIVEQDHRAVKRMTSPMLGFKSFRAAANVVAGFELMHMIRKAQFVIDSAALMWLSDQFYALAGKIRPA